MIHRPLIAAALLLAPSLSLAQTRLGDPAPSPTLSRLSPSSGTGLSAGATADREARRRAEQASTDATRAAQADRRDTAIARATATSSAPLGDPASPVARANSTSVTPVP